MTRLIFVIFVFHLFLIPMNSQAEKSPAEIELEEIQDYIKANNLHWTAAMNPILEMSPEERRKLTGLKLPDNWREIWESHLVEGFPNTADKSYPSSFNWEDSGKVSSVTNQGGCGSCWDFCATAALEAVYMIYYDRELDISEQAVLSCVTPGTGCEGAWMDDAYGYFKNFGAIAEECMPYQADDMVPCNHLSCQILTRMSDWIAVPNSIRALKEAVMIAPIAVAFTVYGDFYGYDGGCYSNVGSGELNHGVLLVGWDDSMCGGIGAWRAKNSWGENWGDNGYFWIEYNAANFGEGGSLVLIDSSLSFITPSSLPAGNPCEEFEYQFEAQGGVPPHSYEVIGGELPPGLILEEDGRLHGSIAGAEGAYQFQVRVNDSPYQCSYFFDDFTLSIESIDNGDANCDGILNLSDILFLIDYLYGTGDPPRSMGGCDCDCSMGCDLGDILYLIEHVYMEGPEPCAY